MQEIEAILDNLAAPAKVRLFHVTFQNSPQPIAAANPKRAGRMKRIGLAAKQTYPLKKRVRGKVHRINRMRDFFSFMKIIAAMPNEKSSRLHLTK